MIKDKIDNKGWEILCDNCKDNVIGYVGQEEKPSEEEYFGIICSQCWQLNNPEILDTNNNE
jgi:hypothetical protein